MKISHKRGILGTRSGEIACTVEVLRPPTCLIRSMLFASIIGRRFSCGSVDSHVTLCKVTVACSPLPTRRTGMSYRIAGIDVHKKMLAVVVADVASEGAYEFERRK